MVEKYSNTDMLKLKLVLTIPFALQLSNVQIHLQQLLLL